MRYIDFHLLLGESQSKDAEFLTILLGKIQLLFTTVEKENADKDENQIPEVHILLEFVGKDNRRHEGKRTETFQNIFVIPVSQVDATDIHTVVNIVEIQCNA